VHEVQIDVVETQSSKAPLERPLCPEGFKGEELRVTQISSRGTPLVRIASPTPRSFR